jgi:hypothetical protein
MTMKILLACFAIACVFLLIDSAPQQQQQTTKKPDSSSEESFEAADANMRSSEFNFRCNEVLTNFNIIF